MVDAARKHNRVVQLGTQQRSGLHYQEAVKLIRDGAIGTVSRVHCWNHSNDAPQGAGNWPDGNPPEGLDWDMYLGPRPGLQSQPVHRTLPVVPGTMPAGLRLGRHHLDIIQWAMGVDAPRAVTASGGSSPSRTTVRRLTRSVLHEYPKFIASFSSRAANARPYGKPWLRDRVLRHRRDAVHRPLRVRDHSETKPDLPVAAAPRAADEVRRRARTKIRRSRRPRTASMTAGSEQNQPHVKNFLDCVKSRQRPISDVETGHRSTSTAHLGNVALRSGRRIEWDTQPPRASRMSRRRTSPDSCLPRSLAFDITRLAAHGWWLAAKPAAGIGPPLTMPVRPQPNSLNHLNEGGPRAMRRLDRALFQAAAYAGTYVVALAARSTLDR